MNDAFDDLMTGESRWWEEVEQGTVLCEDAAVYGDKAKSYDLEERVAKFGEAVVRFSRHIPRHPTNDRLTNQLAGAATSIGANYLEATEAVSTKDFRYPISRSKKEAKETKFFLRMVVASEPCLADSARALYREAHELHLIFAAIHRKTKPEEKVQLSRVQGERLSPEP